MVTLGTPSPEPRHLQTESVALRVLYTTLYSGKSVVVDNLNSSIM